MSSYPECITKFIFFHSEILYPKINFVSISEIMVRLLCDYGHWGSRTKQSKFVSAVKWKMLNKEFWSLKSSQKKGHMA